MGKKEVKEKRKYRKKSGRGKKIKDTAKNWVSTSSSISNRYNKIENVKK